jgi:DnaJ homolog subfamily C member 7
MNIFSKSGKKLKKSSTSDDDTGRLSPSPSPSPPKKTHFRPNKDKDRDENRRPGPSRNSSTFSRAQSFSPILDPNSHPLNLPPDQLRRMSALSNMSGEPFQMDPMEVDREVPNGSPIPLQSPQPVLRSSSSTPTAKKVNGATNSSTANSKAPAPPPHKSAPTSPITPQASITEEAEAFKTAGNRYYKAKEYKKAIEEYTKGVCNAHVP